MNQWRGRDPNEIWDICEKKAQDIVENKLGITTETGFDRWHCTGKFRKNQSKLRKTVCRLLRFKGKENFLQSSKKLQDAGFFIYKDFCKTTMELQKSLWEEVLLILITDGLLQEIVDNFIICLCCFS